MNGVYTMLYVLRLFVCLVLAHRKSSDVLENFLRVFIVCTR